MVTIDLSNTGITAANEKIRACGLDHSDVEIINPDARHNIGVGLVVDDQADADVVARVGVDDLDVGVFPPAGVNALVGFGDTGVA